MGLLAFRQKTKAGRIRMAARPAPERILVTGDRFISSSGGNDNNDGKTTGTAWATLAKASQYAYAPGSTIQLNKGDTFTGTFEPHGSSPDFGSGTWITIQSYGAGAKPIIDGSSNTTECGIKFDRYEISDGWKVVGIAFQNQKLCGIDKEKATKRHDNGFYLDSCDFTGITGAGIMTTISTSETRFQNPGYDIWYSWGANIQSTDNVTITTCTFTNCDGPMAIWACATGRITACTVTNATRGGITVTGFSGSFYYQVAPDLYAQGNSSIEIDHNNVTGVGSTGWVNGTAGIQVAQIATFSLHDNIVDTVQNVSNPTVDMVGLDLEGGISSCTIANDTYRNLNGAGMLLNHNTNFANVVTSFSMTGCTFQNFSQASPTGIPFIRQNTNNSDVISITGNTISRGTSKLFGTVSNNNLTDTPPASPPAQWTFSGNTIT